MGGDQARPAQLLQHRSKALIALDTNILVYAHRVEYDRDHLHAKSLLADLASQSAPWTVHPHCMTEFLCTVTRASFFATPTEPAAALSAANALRTASSFVFIPYGQDEQLLEKLIAESSATGPEIYDARIAAGCLEGGVTELWSADRFFLERLRSLRALNPLF